MAGKFLWSTQALGRGLEEPSKVASQKEAPNSAEEHALLRWASAIAQVLIKVPGASMPASALTAALQQQNAQRFDPLEVGLALGALQRRGSIQSEKGAEELLFRLTEAGRSLA
jgi:hypothetical protein